MFKRRRTRYNDKSNKEYLDTIARQFFNKCYDKYDKKLSKYRSFKSLSMCLLRLDWVFYYQRNLVERKFKSKFLDLTKQRRLAMLTRSPRLSILAQLHENRHSLNPTNTQQCRVCNMSQKEFSCEIWHKSVYKCRRIYAQRNPDQVWNMCWGS